MDTLTQVLTYEKMGLSIIPLRPKDKHPNGDLLPTNTLGRPEWKSFQTTRADSDQILSWWVDEPAGNIGIVTGSVSGAVVLDIDSDEGQKNVDERGGIPNTPLASTANGLHIYLAHPGFEVANFARKLPGLDFRGDGGYVVAPPSVHPSGKSYIWDKPFGSIELAPVPVWLLKLLQPEEKMLPPLRPVAYSGGVSKLTQATVDNTIARLRIASDGHRNDELNKASYIIGKLVGAGSYNQTEAEDMLAGEGRSLGLSEHEIAATVNSGLTKGKSEPFAPEPVHVTTVAKPTVVTKPDEDMVSMSDVAAKAKATAKSWTDTPKQIRGYSCGIEELDTVTGGFLENDLLVVLGRTGAGKSSLAMQFAISFATQAPVLIFTTEMVPEWYTHRIASYMHGINAREIFTGQAGKDPKFLAHYDTAAKMPITFYKHDSPDPDKIIRTGEAFKAKGGKIMIVDSLQNVSQSGMGTYPGTVAICDALRYCVRDVGLFVMATCQANRGPSDRSDKEPLISDAQGGGVIEQNATRFLTVYRPGYDIETRQVKPKMGEEMVDPNVAYLTLVKDRWFGAQGKRIETFYSPGRGFQKLTRTPVYLGSPYETEAAR